MNQSSSRGVVANVGLTSPRRLRGVVKMGSGGRGEDGRANGSSANGTIRTGKRTKSDWW